MTNDELRETCERATRLIAAKLKPELDLLKRHGVGVTILAFTFNPGAIAYLSTAEREGMIRALKEFIAYAETMQTQPLGPKAKG